MVNISASGICILRNAFLEKGDEINIRFPFKSKNILLTAKIIRVEGKEVGIKFLDDDEIIENFIIVFNKEYPQLGKEDKDKVFSENVDPYAEDKDSEDDFSSSY